MIQFHPFFRSRNCAVEYASAIADGTKKQNCSIPKKCFDSPFGAEHEQDPNRELGLGTRIKEHQSIKIHVDVSSRSKIVLLNRVFYSSNCGLFVTLSRMLWTGEARKEREGGGRRTERRERREKRKREEGSHSHP